MFLETYKGILYHVLKISIKLTTTITAEPLSSVKCELSCEYLRQLKTGIAWDCVAQFLTERAFPLVVGQLQQVETCRRSRKSVLRILLTYREKTPDYTACNMKQKLSKTYTSMGQSKKIHTQVLIGKLKLSERLTTNKLITRLNKIFEP